MDDVRPEASPNDADQLVGNDTEFRPDWNQLGVPILALAADGRLLRCNRSFAQLARSSGYTAASHPSQWLQLWANESRALLFAALADRRAAVTPLGWIGSTLAGVSTEPAVQRWYSASLRWRQTGSYCIVVLHDVTLVRRAEMVARAQAEQLRGVIQASGQLSAYFEASGLNCQFANRAFTRAHGHDEAAVTGKPLLEVLGAEGARLAQPAIEQALRTRQPARYEQWMQTVLPEALQQAGDAQTAQQMEVLVSPHLDATGALLGIVITMNDVTHLRETERAVSESQDRLARFMHAGLESIVFHRQGVIVDANPACCDLLGLSLNQLLGRDLLELVVPEQRQRVERVINLDDSRRIETTLLLAEDQRLPVELMTHQVLEDGVPLHTVVLRDVRERQAAQERLFFLAHHDALTGLANRQSFMSQLEQTMGRARAAGTELTLLFIDLDGFRRVNDSLGHAAGDARLKTVARRICDNLRATDKVARFGGDEFMVLLPGGPERIDVPGVAGKLQSAIGAPLDVGAGSVSLSASIGISVFPRDGDTPDALIRHADAAMHKAKAKGSAGVVFYQPEHADRAYADLVLESELATAIQQEEFTLVFQPQVDKDGLTVGAEALIRWRHPQRGLLSPDEFIELAEQHRLMLPIGNWVLQAAAEAAREWHAMDLGRPLSVAVNLSTLQFRADDFVASVAQVLAESGLPRGWLEFELTERMLIDDLDNVRQRLAELRELGIRISVDDFGTGHSSLGHLQTLPIDKLKVDRCFIQELPAGRSSGAIVTAIVQLAHSLDLVVVAEGVESHAQQRFLARLGCDLMQGMGISAPLTREAMQDWLLTQPRPDDHPTTIADPGPSLLGSASGIF
ncbi:MAG: hypothetical protein RL722_653 [Pseudomonadota bacterium]|jgi:diguanylate cyclase (GGDEF)-like protein/PAS domain S-box-containing protein